MPQGLVEGGGGAAGRRRLTLSRLCGERGTPELGGGESLGWAIVTVDEGQRYQVFSA